jgi:hypothetical protein
MNDKPTEAEIVEAMRIAIAIRIPDPDKPDGYTAARAALAAQRAMGLVLVSAELVEFLRGAGPLDGYWFGDQRPDKLGRFWWREHLPAMNAAAQGEME